jgi:hypothetical protein
MVAVAAYLNIGPEGLSGQRRAEVEQHERWDDMFTLIDLLADLKHFAVEMEFDFDECLRMADGHWHYEAEEAGTLETLEGSND